MRTVRDAVFVPEWVDLSTEYPTPVFDHISRQYLDIPYGQHKKQALDIYLPEEGKAPFPTMIIVHGGGFSRGDKRDLSVYPGFYGLREGFAVVGVNYRFLPEDRFPSQIHDVKAAIRFLRRHSSEYGLDPEHFFLYGDSAGGHLVSMVGVTQHAPILDDEKAFSEVSCAVQGVAAVAPLINLERQYSELEQTDYMRPELKAAMLDESSTILSDYVGREKGNLGEMAKTASVDTYLTEHTPPFYLQHGSVDTILSKAQSVDFAEKLREKIGKENVALEIIDGAKHVGTSPEFIEEEHLMPILNFFKRFL